MNGPVDVIRAECHHCGGDRDVQISSPLPASSGWMIAQEYPDERECWCLSCGRVETWAWRRGVLEQAQRNALYLAA